MASWAFPATDPIDLHVSILSGSVSITAEPAAAVTVAAFRHRPRGDDRTPSDDDIADDLDIEFAAGRLEIEQRDQRGLHLRSTDVHLVIGVPAQSHCTVRSMAASVSCEGAPGSLDVRTASGKVEAGSVSGPVGVNTMSGQVRIGRAEGETTLHTASGQIQLRYAGSDVIAGSASGEVSIGTADGSVSVKTASGRVRIGSVTRGHTEVNSVSGDVEIRVASGTGVYLDLASVTGRVSSDLDPSEQDGSSDLRLHARTVSGSLRVTRATPAEKAS